MEKNTEPQESKVKIEMYKRKNKTYVVKHGDPKRLKTTKLKHHDQTNKKRKKKKPKKPQKARTLLTGLHQTYDQKSQKNTLAKQSNYIFLNVEIHLPTL